MSKSHIATKIDLYLNASLVEVEGIAFFEGQVLAGATLYPTVLVAKDTSKPSTRMIGHSTNAPADHNKPITFLNQPLAYDRKYCN